MPGIHAECKGELLHGNQLFVLQFGIVWERLPLCRKVLEEIALKLLQGGSNIMVML